LQLQGCADIVARTHREIPILSRLCQFPTVRLRQGPGLETRQTQKVIGTGQLAGSEELSTISVSGSSAPWRGTTHRLSHWYCHHDLLHQPRTCSVPGRVYRTSVLTFNH